MATAFLFFKAVLRQLITANRFTAAMIIRKPRVGFNCIFEEANPPRTHIF
jgi:hypothetical protein